MLEALAAIPPFILIMFLMAFVAGIATIPLVAYGLGGMLPGFVAEPMANLLLTLAFFGMDAPTLHQTETGEYEFVDGGGSGEPAEYWTRFAMSRFGITAAMTDGAFSTLAVDPRDVETETIGGERDLGVVATLNRGGKQWFMELGVSAQVVLPIGQVLSKFQNSAGLDLAVDAAAQGEKEHGGDTSSFSPKMRLMGGALFTFMGLFAGVFVFYL